MANRFFISLTLITEGQTARFCRITESQPCTQAPGDVTELSTVSEGTIRIPCTGKSRTDKDIILVAILASPLRNVV
jgi:hypothetical protein